MSLQTNFRSAIPAQGLNVIRNACSWTTCGVSPLTCSACAGTPLDSGIGVDWLGLRASPSMPSLSQDSFVLNVMERYVVFSLRVLK